LDPSLGSGYIVLGFAEGLRARGHEVELLGPEHFEPGHGVMRGRAVLPRQVLGMARAALAEVQSREWEVVELFGGSSWLAAELLLRMGPGRPLVVLRSNGLEPHYGERWRQAIQSSVWPRGRQAVGFGAERRYAKVLSRADGVVTVSEWDCSWAIQRSLASEPRMTWIDNPLPDEYLGQETTAERERLFGFCGSWSPRKGADLLEQAVPEVLRRCPEWRFVLLGVGGGDMVRAAFPTDVRERVTAISPRERNVALRKEYAKLRVLVMPSIYESFGLVAAESMACGCALVASRVGFPACLEDGIEAELLGEVSAKCLEETLAALLASPERMRRIAAAGQRRVQQLRWDKAIDRIELLYSTWLGQHRGTSGGVRSRGR